MDGREALVERLARAVDGLDGVEPKSMFGAAGHCVDGKVFCMVTKDSVFAFKVDDPLAYDGLLVEPGVKPWNPRGGERPFGRWLAMPADLAGDEATLAEWVALAHRHIGGD